MVNRNESLGISNRPVYSFLALVHIERGNLGIESDLIREDDVLPPYSLVNRKEFLGMGISYMRMYSLLALVHIERSDLI